MLGALVFALAACGGSDGSSEGSSSNACITNDDEGRPGICTVYAGSMYDEVMGMDLFCPESQVVDMERAKRCPTGDGLVGHCKHDAGEAQEMHVYYYLYDDVDDGGASFLRESCVDSEGIWIP
jgi:hypothetical protein